MPLHKYQSVKEAKKGNASTKLNVSQFGFPYDAKMFQLVGYWHTIFAGNSEIGGCDPEYINNWEGKYWLTMKRPDFQVPVPTSASSQTAFLLAKMRQAIETGNGDFFLKLADTIERFKNSPVDRIRHWLSEKFYVELSQDGTEAKGFLNFLGTEIPREEITLRQLDDMRKKEGIPGDEWQLRRACKQWGIKLAEGHPGRPKGSRGKSRDPK
jgi:hypothetical protein